MKTSLRDVLAQSQVAAIAIAVLLLWGIDALLRALWEPLYRVITFLFTAVAIRDIPYYSFSRADWLLWILALFNLLFAFLSLAAAWLLSQWVHGVGPFRSLRQCVASLKRRHSV